MYVPCFVYLFTHQWTLELHPDPNYCEECCDKHSSANIVRLCLPFFGNIPKSGLAESYGNSLFNFLLAYFSSTGIWGPASFSSHLKNLLICNISTGVAHCDIYMCAYNTSSSDSPFFPILPAHNLFLIFWWISKTVCFVLFFCNGYTILHSHQQNSRVLISFLGFFASYFYSLYLFHSIGVWTQGLVLARKVLYTWATPPNFLLLSFLE
jgi:hypothetical protein